MLNLDNISRFKSYRFSRTAIGYAVWAYHRFAQSPGDVDDFLGRAGRLRFLRVNTGVGREVRDHNL